MACSDIGMHNRWDNIFIEKGTPDFIQNFVIDRLNSIEGEESLNELFRKNYPHLRLYLHWVEQAAHFPSTKTTVLKVRKKVDAANSICGKCMKVVSNTLRTCPKCQVIAYCSRTCLKGDNKTHKVMCKKLISMKEQSTDEKYFEQIQQAQQNSENERLRSMLKKECDEMISSIKSIRKEKEHLSTFIDLVKTINHGMKNELLKGSEMLKKRLDECEKSVTALMRMNIEVQKKPLEQSRGNLASLFQLRELMKEAIAFEEKERECYVALKQLTETSRNETLIECFQQIKNQHPERSSFFNLM